MNVKLIDLKGREASETAENLIAALKKARDQGEPFVIKWRQSDAQAQRWQSESHAGCGCGTGSEFFPGP